MTLKVDCVDAQERTRRSVARVVTEKQGISVRRPAWIGAGLIIWHGLLRAATIRRDHVNMERLAWFLSHEGDAASVRRPARLNDLQRRECQLHSVAAVQIALPKRALRIRNVSEALPAWREVDPHIYDFGGGISAGGSGPIPASDVTISGGSVSSAKVTVTLNVDTCALNFSNSYGLCGPINVSWVELPASVGGSFANHGDSRNLFPGGGGVATNGSTVTYFASATGTMLDSDVPQGATGTLTQGTNITRTIIGP